MPFLPYIVDMKNKNGTFKAFALEDFLKIMPTHVSLVKETYKGLTKKAQFVDEKYGSFFIAPYLLLKGQDHPARGRVKNSMAKTMTAEMFQSKLPKHLMLKVETYINASSKCILIDSVYGEFIARPTMVLQGKKEHPERIKSKYVHPQQKLYIDNMPAKEWCRVHNLPYSSLKSIWYLGEDYIRQWKENYKTSKSTLEVFVSQRLQIPPFNKYPNSSLKYKPDFKLADSFFVNTDGLYWHSEKEKTDKRYHYTMREKFEQHKLCIMQFTSDQILNKWPIVHSIIRNKIKQAPITIYEMHYDVRLIKDVDAADFINKNHLNGYSGATSIGIFSANILLGVVSFRIKGGKLKIERFCTLLDHSVVNGLSQAIVFLIKNYNIDKVQYWVDLRYDNGNEWVQLGFKKSKTMLDWKWTDGHNTFNKSCCRANMDERRLTEKEYATKLKWYKIYDAGQALFERHVNRL